MYSINIQYLSIYTVLFIAITTDSRIAEGALPRLVNVTCMAKGPPPQSTLTEF